MTETCPVPGCDAVTEAAHTCGLDALDRHSFDAPEEQGVRLNAWLAPMTFGASQSWVWLAFTEMTIDAQHQQKEHANG